MLHDIQSFKGSGEAVFKGLFIYIGGAVILVM